VSWLKPVRYAVPVTSGRIAGLAGLCSDVAYDTTPERMDEQLGFVMPALTERRLRAYVEFINEETEAYFGGWPDAGEFELKHAVVAALMQAAVGQATRVENDLSRVAPMRRVREVRDVAR
jgi:cytochrome P450